MNIKGEQLTFPQEIQTNPGHFKVFVAASFYFNLNEYMPKICCVLIKLTFIIQFLFNLFYQRSIKIYVSSMWLQIRK